MQAEPSSVSPMYMPGRLRTASRPRNTLIDSAPYPSPPFAVVSSTGSSMSFGSVGAYSGLAEIRPSSTPNLRAAGPSPSNSERSVPVIQVWADRSISNSNSASRLVASR